MRFLFELFVHRIVRAGGFGDVEAAEFIEVGNDRAVDESRAGDLLDDETFRDGEVVRADLEFRGVGKWNECSGKRRKECRTAGGLHEHMLARAESGQSKSFPE